MIWRSASGPTDGSAPSAETAKGTGCFGALLHREQGTEYVDVYAAQKPYFASMLEEVVRMFQTKTPPLDIEETIEVIAFLEAANESRATGKSVPLRGSFAKRNG